MSLVCLNWETAHLYREAWISHHRLRHRVFVERQRWQVPSYNGLEYDQFDTPAAHYILWLDGDGQARGVGRLIPTTRPYTVEALWPELVDGALPRVPEIWEATRFGCDRSIDVRTRRRIVAELICGCQEFGIANGIRKYLGLMPLGIFKNVVVVAGCTVTLLESATQIAQHDVAAAYIDISPRILATVRSCAAIVGQVLDLDLPQSDARTVAAAAIGGDQQAAGVGTTFAPHELPGDRPRNSPWAANQRGLGSALPQPRQN